MSQSEPVRGSVVIVGVGASRGLGAAIARRFAREGYPVVIAGRSQDKLDATLAEPTASQRSSTIPTLACTYSGPVCSPVRE